MAKQGMDRAHGEHAYGQHEAEQEPVTEAGEVDQRLDRTHADIPSAASLGPTTYPAR